MATPARPGGAVAPPQPDADLNDVRARVHEEYDDRLDPQVVNACLDEVASRFSGAKVRSFVPLLVRRYVRAELQGRLGGVGLRVSRR